MGDTPSDNSLSKHVAFVGASCEPRLVTWLIAMGAGSLTVWTINTTDQACIHHARMFNISSKPVVALGKRAQNRLGLLGVAYHGLPHPSGLSRALNDKEGVVKMMQDAHLYIREVLAGKPASDELGGVATEHYNN